MPARIALRPTDIIDCVGMPKDTNQIVGNLIETYNSMLKAFTICYLIRENRLSELLALRFNDKSSVFVRNGDVLHLVLGQLQLKIHKEYLAWLKDTSPKFLNYLNAVRVVQLQQVDPKVGKAFSGKRVSPSSLLFEVPVYSGGSIQVDKKYSPVQEFNIESITSSQVVSQVSGASEMVMEFTNQTIALAIRQIKTYVAAAPTHSSRHDNPLYRLMAYCTPLKNRAFDFMLNSLLNYLRENYPYLKANGLVLAYYEFLVEDKCNFSSRASDTDLRKLTAGAFHLRYSDACPFEKRKEFQEKFADTFHSLTGRLRWPPEALKWVPAFDFAIFGYPKQCIYYEVLFQYFSLFRRGHFGNDVVAIQAGRTVLGTIADRARLYIIPSSQSEVQRGVENAEDSVVRGTLQVMQGIPVLPTYADKLPVRSPYAERSFGAAVFTSQLPRHKGVREGFGDSVRQSQVSKSPVVTQPSLVPPQGADEERSGQTLTAPEIAVQVIPPSTSTTARSSGGSSTTFAFHLPYAPLKKLPKTPVSDAPSADIEPQVVPERFRGATFQLTGDINKMATLSGEETGITSAGLFSMPRKSSLTAVPTVLKTDSPSSSAGSDSLPRVTSSEEQVAEEQVGEGDVVVSGEEVGESATVTFGGEESGVGVSGEGEAGVGVLGVGEVVSDIEEQVGGVVDGEGVLGAVVSGESKDGVGFSGAEEEAGVGVSGEGEGVVVGVLGEGDVVVSGEEVGESATVTIGGEESGGGEAGGGAGEEDRAERGAGEGVVVGVSGEGEVGAEEERVDDGVGVDAEEEGGNEEEVEGEAGGAVEVRDAGVAIDAEKDQAEVVEGVSDTFGAGEVEEERGDDGVGVDAEEEGGNEEEVEGEAGSAVEVRDAGVAIDAEKDQAEVVEGVSDTFGASEGVGEESEVSRSISTSSGSEGSGVSRSTTTSISDGESGASSSTGVPSGEESESMGKTDNSSPLADSQDSASALGVTSVGSGEISSSSGSPSTVVQAKAEAEDEYEYYSSDDQNNLKDVV